MSKTNGLKTFFAESAKENNRTYGQYLMRLTELSVAMFDWQGLPDSIDPRFLELTLFMDGQAVFFKDDDLDYDQTGIPEDDSGNEEAEESGTYLALQVTANGRLDVYHVPIKRRAFGLNGYSKQLTNKDSVIIYNNMLHTNNVLDVLEFSRRLYNLDRIIDVNANAQKTPVLVQGTEQQRLTLLQVYKEFDGNAPVIFGDKSLDLNALKSLNTGAPYVADKLYELKTQIWNEALTYLGISNTSFQKKERLVSDEVIRSQGGTIASRYSRLESRRRACDQINKMFGLNVTCDYREDYREAGDTSIDEGESGHEGDTDDLVDDDE